MGDLHRPVPERPRKGSTPSLTASDDSSEDHPCVSHRAARESMCPSSAGTRVPPGGHDDETRQARAFDPAHPRRPQAGAHDVRRQGPGLPVSADRAGAPAGRGAERPRHPARRRGLRLVERVRRAVRDAGRREAGGRRAEVHPLPHLRAVLAHPAGDADRPQSPLGRDGRHHGDSPRRRPATTRCARTPRRRCRSP